MGLDVNGIRLVLYAKKIGVNFQKVMTVGRQGLHLPNVKLSSELSKFRLARTSNLNISDGSFSEAFFTFLGATTVHSIDNSAYEGATFVHDMNQPLTEEYKGKYSAVVDAGTLEHVFNYPVAIKNCIEMLESGGHFISITPANNFMGHGFYQFSPELFFSVFQQCNGLELVDLFICEAYEDAQWYRVSAPKGGLQGRVTLRNHFPTYLMCIARRTDATCVPFKTMPQQSDYMDAWEQQHQIALKMQNSNWFNKNGLINAVREALKKVPAMKSLVLNWRYLNENPYPRRDYTPFNPHS